MNTDKRIEHKSHDLTEYSLTKSAVECYKIRHPSGMYWADITIDSKGNAGRIQIASDYGDYQSYWGACGVPFKEFLAKIGIDYAAKKFGANDWFDHEGTLTSYRNDVLNYRRHERITKEEAREMWDEIKALYDCSGKEEFVAEMYQKDALMDFYDHCPDLKKDITPQFKTFWHTCWQVLLSEFKKELEPVHADKIESILKKTE